MRPTLRALLLTATASLGTACGGPLFFVEAEIEEVCNREDDVSFPAAPSGISSIQQNFALPLGDIGASLPDGALETELHLKLFEVNVTHGDVDLSAIEHASVKLRPAGSGTPITLVEYQRPAGAGPLRTLALTASVPVDVMELAREEQLDLTFEARGALPQEQWTGSLRACAGVRAKVEYFDVVF